MSAQPDDADDWDDLLPDDLNPAVTPAVPAKGAAVPLKRTPKQAAAAAAQAERDAVHTANQRLAQIVNLHIAGYSLSAIGAQIGMTGDEVDRMLAQDAQRYVRTQPALRTFVRNYISEKYSGLLDATYKQAVDTTHGQQLEYVDRAQRILTQMGRLHGAEAPTQTEVKVEAAPEAVERLVSALAAQRGQGYDMDVFDAELVEDAVHEIAAQSQEFLETSALEVEASDGHDDL